MSNSKNDLDLAFEQFEQDCGENRTIRRQMINQLKSQVTFMSFSEYDKPMMIQAKLMIGKTLDDLLKSDEDISIKKLKMRLTRKDGETNGMIGETIVALLKNIRADGKDDENPGKKMDPVETMNKLTERVEQIKADGNEKETAAVTVSDGELEQCDKIASDAERPEDEPEEEA